MQILPQIFKDKIQHHTIIHQLKKNYKVWKKNKFEKKGELERGGVGGGVVHKVNFVTQKPKET